MELPNDLSDYGITHVYPLDDLKPHKTSNTTNGYICRCQPSLELYTEDKVALFIHHSYDGREFFDSETEH